MSDYEMPVAVHLTKEELAKAAGRPADDPEIARLGGLNVVFHAMMSPQAKTAAAALAKVDASAHSSLSALSEQLKPLEAKLFQLLRSNPNTAKKFLLDPLATMEQLGLVDAKMRAEILSQRQALSSVFAPKA
jgi:hypothetical protein